MALVTIQVHDSSLDGINDNEAKEIVEELLDEGVYFGGTTRRIVGVTVDQQAVLSFEEAVARQRDKRLSA